MVEHMLSTVDNPWNPFTHFNEWNSWDIASGYYSIAYLARITKLSDDLSEADQSDIIEKAIEEIVKENVLGVYIMVTSDSTPRPLLTSLV